MNRLLKKLTILCSVIFAGSFCMSTASALYNRGATNTSFTISAATPIPVQYRIYNSKTSANIAMTNTSGTLTANTAITNVDFTENNYLKIQSSSDGGSNWSDVATYNFTTEGNYSFNNYNINSSSFNVTVNSKYLYLKDLASGTLKAWYGYYVSTNSNLSSPVSFSSDPNHSGFLKASLSGNASTIYIFTRVSGNNWGGNYDTITTPALTYDITKPLFNLSSFNNALASDFTSIGSPLSTYRTTNNDFDEYLVGGMNNWQNNQPLYGFEKNKDSTSYYLRMYNNTGSSIEFKVRSSGGAWRIDGNNWTISNNQTALIECKNGSVTWHNV